MPDPRDRHWLPLRLAARPLGRLDQAGARRVILGGFVVLILAGWGLLSLPVCRTGPAPAVDVLFTAASAVTTTGLVTVSTPGAHTFWGELVILVLIQVCGIGYMTVASAVVVAATHRLDRTDDELVRTQLKLPDDFNAAIFVRRAVVYTLVIEAAGTLALWPMLHRAGVDDGPWASLWSAIFHSVSSFCTAGFSLYGDSLEGFRSHVGVNAVVSVLAIAGSLGFIALSDVGRSVRRRQALASLTTKVILLVSGVILLVGWPLAYVFDGSVSDLPAGERAMAAFFQVMTASTTAGFNTVPTDAATPAAVWLLVLLMILGANPGGTGGGLKSTTIYAFLAAFRAALSGESRPRFLGRPVPFSRLNNAAAAVALYLFVLSAGTFVLLAREDARFEDLLFEAASAIGTTGLSRGVTSDLTDTSKLTLTALMLIGRVGALTFGLVLFQPADAPGRAAANGEGDQDPESGPADDDRDVAVES